jgi:hypothetical protein
MLLNKVPKIDDLAKIQEAIFDAGYADYGIEVVINVRSHEILEKVNEEFFYSSGNSGNPQDVDVVNVDIGGLNFKYVVKEENT